MIHADQMSLRDKMFSFEGRLRRADYWLISICLGVAVFLLTELMMWAVFGPAYSLFTGGFLAAGERRAAETWPYLVQMLVSLLAAWPGFAMSAKRAHDRNKSARLVVTLTAVMWVANFVQLPILNLLGAWVASPAGVFGYFAFSLIILAICIYLFIVVGCLDGTQGPNRYGPSPKGTVAGKAA